MTSEKKHGREKMASAQLPAPPHDFLGKRATLPDQKERSEPTFLGRRKEAGEGEVGQVRWDDTSGMKSCSNSVMAR